MPRDTAHSGLPARRDFTAPAAPFAQAPVGAIVDGLRVVPDCAAHFEGLREDRQAKSVNLQNLEGFVRKVLGEAAAKADPVVYLRANSSKLTQMFNQACVNDGPCPAHLTDIQASDFSLAIADLDAAAERWAAYAARRDQ